ncbi:MAG: hypothetical protein BWK80_16870 [Desulfobacteraceae bacterium IS3]|nr:MAG: hypothetical protein BWK80_16870 [Desulfobacteraceae bacterium IS3]
MKLRKKIVDSINNMNDTELSLLYEQIKLMEAVKNVSHGKKKVLSIEKINEMTAISLSCWADTVSEEREESR